jgi:uncharacterized membrane protein YphA (DoxX/SURF4 family)
MLANLLKPRVDLAALVLRLGLAAIFVVHGIFKLVQEFPLNEDLPMPVQTFVGCVELIAGLMLAAGLFSRIAAVALAIEQIVIIGMVTHKFAWAGPKFTPEGADFTRVGPEYNLALIALAVAVFFLGSGAVSLDSVIMGALNRKKGMAPTPGAPMAGGARV